MSERELSSSKMTPKAIVSALDQQVVGQAAAKRAVANAIRNHWRRLETPENMQSEIKPKNILMIGPTGVGKTEIARRLATLVGAPFVKVEATTFTEVGYVGRDVTSIVRDLVDVAGQLTRKKAVEVVKQQAEEAAQEQLLDILLLDEEEEDEGENENAPSGDESESLQRRKMRKALLAGKLDDKIIDIEIDLPSVGVEIMAPPGMEEMTNQLQGMFQNISSDRKKKRKMAVSQAFKQLTEQEAAKLINEEDIRAEALDSAEQNGIVFLDEIDKVVRSSEYSGADVSREGVQRDLLPLLEGTTVSTKYGSIATDHILFIASGAFMGVRPSDMISELQGRLPVRVELNALNEDDYYRILLEPDASLTKQYCALMATESVTLKFVKSGIRRIAAIAYQINEKSDNIGARRLQTVMERLLEEVSFSADEFYGQTVTIDEKYVNTHLKGIVEDDDLSRWIL